MNNRKLILYILVAILGVILAYNFIVAPYLMQYNRGMGMGMHSMMRNNYNYYIDSRYILLLIVLIAGVFLFGLLFEPVNKYNICGKCGYTIKDENWRICPICGSSIKNKGRGSI